MCPNGLASFDLHIGFANREQAADWTGWAKPVINAK